MDSVDDARADDLFSQLSAFLPAPAASRSHAVETWFLGPRAENADELEHLILEAFRDHVFWRRNFHPEDPTAITEEIKQSPEYLRGMGSLREHFHALLALLKKSPPFFSMRYQGHMLWENTIPGILGYFAAMLYNNNNVALEASKITTFLEIIVGNELCKMVGYPPAPPPKEVDKDEPRSWGHITCDGTVANIEALWAARNLKFFPVALQAALKNELEKASKIDVTLPQGGSKVIVQADLWELLNIKVDDILELPKRLAETYHISPDELTRVLEKYSVQSLGLVGFSRRYLNGIPPAVCVVPGTKHYSWKKAAAVLGIGSSNLSNTPIDVDARIDVDALKKYLTDCLEAKTPVLEVVAVIGSTEEAAVDPLDKILTLRETFRSKGLEFAVHGDAAWGAYFTSMLRPDASNGESDEDKFLLSAHTRAQLTALAHTDSVTIDPHKTGYAPYPAGALCYRNSAMRNLVTFSAPYIFGGGAEETVGIYGIEGSKPGAAPASVYLSHRVIRPSMGGYGRLLNEALFSCKKFYVRLLHMLEPSDPFIVVPVPRLPTGITPEQLKQLKEIDQKNHDQVMNCKKDRDLLRELGPDLNILAYAFNFKQNKILNKDLGKANAFNKAMHRRLSVKGKEDIYGYELIVTTTEFTQVDYGEKFINGYMGRLGVEKNEDDPNSSVTVLRSMVASPWIDDPSRSIYDEPPSKKTFLNVISDVLRDTAKDVLEHDMKK
ncbi:MAG: pyridoxal phosphate-dependent decarboxylase family protein [Pseudonocardiaceae bacterium]